MEVVSNFYPTISRRRPFLRTPANERAWFRPGSIHHAHPIPPHNPHKGHWLRGFVLSDRFLPVLLTDRGGEGVDVLLNTYRYILSAKTAWFEPNSTTALFFLFLGPRTCDDTTRRTHGPQTLNIKLLSSNVYLVSFIDFGLVNFQRRFFPATNTPPLTLHPYPGQAK